MDKKQKKLITVLVIFFLGVIFWGSGLSGVSIFSSEEKQSVVKKAVDLETGANPFIQGEAVIHPFALEQFDTFPTGGTPDVLAISVADSLNTSQAYRYGSPAEVSDDGWVRSQRETEYGESSFSYKYLGQMSNGNHAVKTASWGGGSGTFMTVMVFESMDRKINSDQYIDFVQLLVYRGDLTLGDRYLGEVEVMGNTVWVGENRALSSSADNRGVYSFD